MQSVDFKEFVSHFVLGGNNPSENILSLLAKKSEIKRAEQLWRDFGIDRGSLVKVQETASDFGILSINAHGGYELEINPETKLLNPSHRVHLQSGELGFNQSTVSTESYISFFRGNYQIKSLLVIVSSCFGGLIKPVSGTTILTSDNASDISEPLTRYNLTNLIYREIAALILNDQKQIKLSELLKRIQSQIPVEDEDNRRATPRIIGEDLNLVLPSAVSKRQKEFLRNWLHGICNDGLENLSDNSFSVLLKARSIFFCLRNNDRLAVMDTNLFAAAITTLNNRDSALGEKLAAFVSRYWIPPQHLRIIKESELPQKPENLLDALKVECAQYRIEASDWIDLSALSQQLLKICRETDDNQLLRKSVIQSLNKSRTPLWVKFIRTSKQLYLLGWSSTPTEINGKPTPDHSKPPRWPLLDDIAQIRSWFKKILN